jgi:hypothetical protein
MSSINLKRAGKSFCSRATAGRNLVILWIGYVPGTRNLNSRGLDELLGVFSSTQDHVGQIGEHWPNSADPLARMVHLQFPMVLAANFCDSIGFSGYR